MNAISRLLFVALFLFSFLSCVSQIFFHSTIVNCDSDSNCGFKNVWISISSTDSLEWGPSIDKRLTQKFKKYLSIDAWLVAT